MVWLISGHLRLLKAIFGGIEEAWCHQNAFSMLRSTIKRISMTPNAL
jgi:hypothetical protein